MRKAIAHTVYFLCNFAAVLLIILLVGSLVVAASHGNRDAQIILAACGGTASLIGFAAARAWAVSELEKL